MTASGEGLRSGAAMVAAALRRRSRGAVGRAVGGAAVAGGAWSRGVVVGAEAWAGVGAGAGWAGWVTVPLSLKSRSCGGPTALPAARAPGRASVAVAAGLVGGRLRGQRRRRQTARRAPGQCHNSSGVAPFPALDPASRMARLPPRERPCARHGARAAAAQARAASGRVDQHQFRVGNRLDRGLRPRR